MNFCGLWGAAGIVQSRGESSQPLVLPQCPAGPSGLGGAGTGQRLISPKKPTARYSHLGDSAGEQGCAGGSSFATLTPSFQGKHQQLSALSRCGASPVPGD